MNHYQYFAARCFGELFARLRCQSDSHATLSTWLRCHTANIQVWNVDCLCIHVLHECACAYICICLHVDLLCVWYSFEPNAELLNLFLCSHLIIRSDILYCTGMCSYVCMYVYFWACLCVCIDTCDYVCTQVQCGHFLEMHVFYLTCPSFMNIFHILILS